MLILGGISGAGMTSVMQDYRPLFMGVTFGFLALAFYLTYRPRRAATADTGAVGDRVPSRSRIMTINKVLLWAVTVIAVAFLFFPQATSRYFAASTEFTPEMDRTLIHIEGMT